MADGTTFPGPGDGDEPQGLEMWTIYDHALDLPDVFAARRYVMTAGQVWAMPDVFTHVEIEPLRDLMRSKGLTCIGRQENDDPVIVEVWL